MSKDVFDITIENRDYIDGEWTTFDKRLPEGVYILRCKDKNDEWFNHKARFETSKGWTEQTAEEWARKYRPHQIASADYSKMLSLTEMIEKMPKKTQEQMEEERLLAIRENKDARRLKRKKLANIFGVKTEEGSAIQRMKPSEVKLNHIYNGDCIEVMKQLPDNFFDAVVTDPPYNLGKKYKSGIDDKKREGDYYKWSYEWVDEAIRVLKPTGQILIALWESYKHHIKVYIEENHSSKMRFIQEIAWKTTGVPRANSGKLRSDVTAFLHFGPKSMKGQPSVNYTWNVDDVRTWKFVKHKNANHLQRNKKYVHPLGKDPGTLMEFYYDGKDGKPNEFKDTGSNFYVLNWMRKFLEVFADYSYEHAIQLFDVPTNIIAKRNLPTTHRDRLDHPCQMPVELPMALIKLVTNPGDKVLEPFNGSGTTAHAATILGRNCTSIEMSPDYVHMAVDRLNRDNVRNQAAIEFWDGSPPKWTMDECEPQFKDSSQKSLLDFFAIGAAGGKRLGEDLVEDISRELQGGFLSVLTE